MMAERQILDHLYDYIDIDNDDFRLASNPLISKELNRLANISHLGLIGKIRPLARHTKLEHAYGVYYLCQLMSQNTRGLVRDKKVFRLGGLFHGIGHLPFSYDIEFIISKLAVVHETTKSFVHRVIEDCVAFCGEDPEINESSKNMMISFNYYELHKWFAVYKIKQIPALNNELGKNIARLILNPSNTETWLLSGLDRLDCVLRDMHHLALGKIEVNLIPLFKQFGKDFTGCITQPTFLAFIEKGGVCLEESVYNSHHEKCLAAIVQQSIFEEIFNNHLSAEELLSLTDAELDTRMKTFNSRQIDLATETAKVLRGDFLRVGAFSCDFGGYDFVDAEKRIAGTNQAGLCAYPKNKGIFVQCIPNNGNRNELSVIENGGFTCINYDTHRKDPSSAIRALANVEEFFPDNRSGTEMSARDNAVRFLFGTDNIRCNFQKYHDDIINHIRMLIPKRELQSDLFHESWKQREWGIFEKVFYEKINWPEEHFIYYPEHWNTTIIETVIRKIRPSNLRKKEGESDRTFQERKERMLEYHEYLEKVLDLRTQSYRGWVLPSVEIYDDSDPTRRNAEIDVLSIYIDNRKKVIIDLREVSYNNSPENRMDKYTNAGMLIQRIKERFSTGLELHTYFNGEEIRKWPER
ncbi:hypothetical protein ABFB09_02775 [Dehalogenimonas sp. THU2]|uniref:hypothetical protein n=1 Tax=Dehalogenimonas sp. THU2 TaxID=3151121 RepID=UPI003218B476